MKKLSRDQWIAVSVGIVVVAFLLFGDTFLGLFSTASNNLEPIMDTPVQTSGVAIEDITVGDGAVAETGDTVTVHYVGTLTNGQKFDSSRDRGEPFTFPLGEGRVIRGWDEGVVGMKVGGVRRLTIDPSYGYGAQQVGSIPANSTLLFEVELLDVVKGSVQVQ